MYKIFVIEDAETDIFEIYRYIHLNESKSRADKFFQKIYEKILSLQKHPERGHPPKELKHLGIYEYLEIVLNPYRIIYRIINKKIFIYCVLDGRRDMQKLLQERLLRFKI
ncbi:Plasmid stabilization system protein [Ignavibacterium album JCM 16511]|uniref:Plasmid stabilization system protein n=1 Tax=Ignavibacterium album (strain DSM 19864 / JCM 16511 / NBRC 101810 / Mat9-16) TaxID=945713 RepID=I0AM54_IGNAJ|nr:type II toxin-antitoxin system RelE/ParE family toxin [Ignavibacterium album]AFH50061.1 Plasmid stabilization system protein [Ignavibacterium album JCM 16511]